MWRGAVAQAIRGKRGQALLRDLAEGMDAMPIKELIAEDLRTEDGAVCALGAAGVKRGINLEVLARREEEDGWNSDQIAEAFDIAGALAKEIQYVNDEGAHDQWKPKKETPAERWTRVRKWVAEHLKAVTP